ncbi:NAD(P)H-dependent flavin oxidoreductase [Aliihoeflea sp. PC F10.4]
MATRFGNPDLAASLRSRLSIPVIAGPMFLISGPDLVIACSRAGVIGSFPTLNARTPGILDQWLGQMTTETAGHAPFAANLIVHASNARIEEDLALVVSHKVPVVISSVGNPSAVVAKVHAYGGKVLADVASLKHARRSAEAGVDGLILLCAGAGGNTGWLNPFAFVGAVREFFDGPIVLAGAISRGRYIHSAEHIGADFAYIGTSFIATRESLANELYQDMLINSSADDVILTDKVTGIPANMLRQSLANIADHSGEQPDGFNLLKEMSALKAWRDIWSAGHGVGDVQSVESVDQLVDRLKQDYEASRARDRPEAA